LPVRRPEPTAYTATIHRPPLSLAGAPDPKRGRAETNPEAASTAVSSEGRFDGLTRQCGGLEPEARDAGVRGGGDLVDFNAVKQVDEKMRNTISVLTTVCLTVFCSAAARPGLIPLLLTQPPDDILSLLLLENVSLRPHPCRHSRYSRRMRRSRIWKIRWLLRTASTRRSAPRQRTA
jgi:hypothetical protein